MTETTPPFLLFSEGINLQIYQSLDELVLDIEGVDVEDNIYQAFDSIGRIVRLGARGVRRTSFTVNIGGVVVESIEEVKDGTEQLRRLIEDHLNAIDDNLGDGATLSELISRCRTVHGA